MRSWERFWEVLDPLGEALGVPGASDSELFFRIKTGWIKSKKIISNRSKIISNRSNIKPPGWVAGAGLELLLERFGEGLDRIFGCFHLVHLRNWA